MRRDHGKLDPHREGVDLSFAAFSLIHAECGEESGIELRLGERSLLGWCSTCAALETSVSRGE
jgi:hypothetical protein